MARVRIHVALAAGALVASYLVGCASPGDPADDGVLRVVASTNVYGDLAETIAAGHADVTSIIDDPSADPHGFEANARVQLALAEADVVILNGGGYDDFAAEMLEASGNDSASVLNVVDIAGLDPSASGFNEHVWYDYVVMSRLVDALFSALGERDPANAGAFRSSADDLKQEIAGLAARANGLAGDVTGAGVIVTEPVPLALLTACGFTDLTPAEFSSAIEEDADVPPTLLQQVLTLVASDDVALVVVNEQTGGPQTDAVIHAADTADVPWLGVTETLPAGTHYVEWQSGLLDLIEDAITP